MIEKILIENGMSPKEAKIYLAILQAGEISISRIATQTHIKRTSIYVLVEEMREKNLISVSKRHGIQYVSALSPRILIERFKKSAQLAEHLLPELLEMSYASPLKPRIQFFDGSEGIQQILREFSYSQTPSMGFTDYENMPKTLLKFIREEVVPARRTNKNLAKLIVPDNPTNRLIQGEDKKYYSEHKLVKFPLAENPIELLLFGESNIAFLSFVKEEMFGLIIDSAAIYKTMKNIFLLIWATPS